MIDLPERRGKERETPILRRILVAVNRLPGVRATRNNTGALPNASGALIPLGGFGVGSPDIVFRMQLGGPANILPVVGWLEVKRPGGHTAPSRREAQAAWRMEAATRGELAAVVHSEVEAIEAVEGMRAEYTRRVAVLG